MSYEIKPLTWEPPFAIADCDEVHAAKLGTLGQYTVAHDAIGWRWRSNVAWKPCESLEAGKAACEAHWQARPRECLVPVEPPADVLRGVLLEVVESGARQWLPIETAPKDGTAVLVMRNIWPGSLTGRAETCNGHNTYVAEFWEDEDGGNGEWVCYMDAIQDPRCPVEPTHWMPLPAPPEVKP